MSVQSSRPTGVTKSDRTATPKEAWLIVALLFLFMLINFADKAVIGIAAPVLTSTNRVRNTPLFMVKSA